MTLALVRVSGMVAFAPFFSSTALPMRAKAVFVRAVAFLLAPLVATLPGAHAEIGFSALLGELARGAGLRADPGAAERDAALCRADRGTAVQLLAGQPDGSGVRRSRRRLLGDLFQLMGTLVVIAAGLDRILLASLVRSFRAVPLGSYALAPVTALAHCARGGRNLSGRGRTGRAGPGRHHAGRDCRGAAGQAQPAVAGDVADRAHQDADRLCHSDRIAGPVAALHRGALCGTCSIWPSG